MLATPTITQLHVPKAAGSWLRRYLSNFAPGDKSEFVFQDHYPGELASREGLLRGREVWATVRPPKGFYESLWLHVSHNPATVDSLKGWGRGSVAFDEVLYGWTHPREAEPVPGPYEVGVFTPQLPGWFDLMQEHNMGLCSFLHAYILGPWISLKSKGVSVEDWFPTRYFFPEDLHYLYEFGPVNTAEDRNSDVQRPLLTPQEESWIKEADASFIEQLASLKHG